MGAFGKESNIVDKFIEYCYILLKPTNLLGIRSDER